VTNLVTLPLAIEMHKTAFEYPPGIDEFEAAALEKAPSLIAELLAQFFKSREGRRMERLDGLPTNFSAVGQK
jgi:hypothetical protein